MVFEFHLLHVSGFLCMSLYVFVFHLLHVCGCFCMFLYVLFTLMFVDWCVSWLCLIVSACVWFVLELASVCIQQKKKGGVARCVAKLIRVDFTLGRILAYYKWVCGVFDCEAGSRPRERHWRIPFILWWDVYKACIRWNDWEYCQFVPARPGNSPKRERCRFQLYACFWCESSCWELMLCDVESWCCAMFRVNLVRCCEMLCVHVERCVVCSCWEMCCVLDAASS